MRMIESRVEQLFQLFNEARQRCEHVSVETLCQDCPELADELQRRIKAAKITDRLSNTSTLHEIRQEFTLAPATQRLSDELQPGAEPVPGYRLVARLGSGSYGEVWKALAPGEFAVALKFVSLSTDASSTELRGLEIIKTLRHPNLLSLVGSWQTSRHLVIAMELADRTLWDRFQEAAAQGHSCIPRNELWEYLYEAAKGIDFLNEPRQQIDGQSRRGVQHRDIKPQNILLVGNGVKVGDFGLVQLLEDTAGDHSGGLTPRYAAPEFFEGHTFPQSDQYSLAVTYCHLRGGRLPFDGSNLSEFMYAHLNNPPDLSMLPHEEHSIVARALAKNPAKRWPNCLAFAVALKATGMKRDPSPWTLQRVVAVAVLSFAVLSSWFWVFRHHSESSQNSEFTTPSPPMTNKAPPVDTDSKVNPDTNSEPAIVPAKGTAEQPVGSQDSPRQTAISTAVFVSSGDNPNRAIAVKPASQKPPAVDPPSRPTRGFPKVLPKVNPKPLNLREYSSPSTGMKLTEIPAGEFIMGSPTEEEEYNEEQGPQHIVGISRPFYLGVYEVTQAEYFKVMETNPSWFSNGGIGSGRSKVGRQDTNLFPVEMVSWYDAIEFCNKLSLMDNLTPYYTLGDSQRETGSIKSAIVSVTEGNGYRLPTEAQWEYACRAGTTTPFHFGSTLNGDNANVNGNSPYGTITNGTYLERTTTVDDSRYLKNDFGLAQMHGNVCEWCFDAYLESAYRDRNEVTADPVIMTGSKTRVVRGGSWGSHSKMSRAAHRFGVSPGSRVEDFGFRIVCVDVKTQ